MEGGGRNDVELEIGVSGFNKEKLLITATEVEGKEAKEGNEGRVTAVLIVLDEGTRAVGEEEVSMEERGWDVVGKVVLVRICGMLVKMHWKPLF